MSPLGSVEDRCMGYDLLQLIVNRQSSYDTKLKKKKKGEQQRATKSQSCSIPPPTQGPDVSTGSDLRQPSTGSDLRQPEPSPCGPQLQGKGGHGATGTSCCPRGTGQGHGAHLAYSNSSPQTSHGRERKKPLAEVTLL